jgi:hypothetical protein
MISEKLFIKALEVIKRQNNKDFALSDFMSKNVFDGNFVTNYSYEYLELVIEMLKSNFKTEQNVEYSLIELFVYEDDFGKKPIKLFNDKNELVKTITNSKELYKYLISKEKENEEK